jgi:hypothetical protein
LAFLQPADDKVARKRVGSTDRPVIGAPGACATEKGTRRPFLPSVSHAEERVAADAIALVSEALLESLYKHEPAWRGGLRCGWKGTASDAIS